MTIRTSKYKPGMEIQYGGRPFAKPQVGLVHLGCGFKYFIEIWFENRFTTPQTGVTNGNSIKYCRKTANINVKKNSVL